jgi:hypothetical protein
VLVGEVRDGNGQREVARRHGVSLSVVQRWLRRAGDLPLDAVDWRDRPRSRLSGSRTAEATEELVVATRLLLRESDLGEYGAVAIHRALEARDDLPGPVPAVRTIGRILARRGELPVHRPRRPAPPPGWYLSAVRANLAELDSFDAIDEAFLVDRAFVRRKIPLDVLTGTSLHGGLVSAWPMSGLRSGHVAACLLGRWRACGLPGYAQFDNDARFIGGTSVPDSIGLVIRFCLAAKVTPVFVPPAELGWQAQIERFNGLWQEKVLARLDEPTLDELVARSDAYIAASRARHSLRIAAAPPRHPLPAGRIDPGTPAAGRILFIRRASDAGRVTILNRRYRVGETWANRHVRAELDIDAGRIEIFGLRRSAPDFQPYLASHPYDPPARWFR